MLDWTDRHCRYFHRLLAPHALLHTEMVTAAAIAHGDRGRLLAFDLAEQPVALQLGGADPRELAAAARIGSDFGYAEINLNVGCPSDRVQSGRFGACLMREPARVAECFAAMAAAVCIPVTVKCRLGVDEDDEEAALGAFVEALAVAGCRIFIVHARKAWLQGLSPKENREVPPLNHALVHRLKAAHPELEVVVNGGIRSVDEVREHLRHVDGVMLGRVAWQEPWRLAELEEALHGVPLPEREQVIDRFRPYAEAQLAGGVRLQQLVRPLLGLFHGLPGGRAFRRVLSEEAHRPGADWRVMEQALAAREAAAFEVA